MSKIIKKFFLCFAQDFLSFRLPEMASIVKLFNLDLKVEANEKPYWIVFGTESDLIKFASRSVLLRYIVEIWSSGTDYEKFHSSLRTNLKEMDMVDLDLLSFKITVESYNKHIKQIEKVERIESMDYLPLNGKIDLKNPELNLIYYEFWGLDHMNVPEEPEEIVFGKLIVHGKRDIVKTISLKTRKFIGNTSMNPLLSLLMANQALCEKNQIVYDPFAGTGSLLVAAAKFGSYVLGSDIDFLMLHGKTKPSRVQQKVRDKDESIKSNMVQYNLQHLYLDIFVADFSNCPFVDSIRFDSIITDPPYGVREKIEQVVSKEGRKATVLNENAAHYPSTSTYSIKNMYDDLLKFATKHLNMNGRLVCWFPIAKDIYDEKYLPQHSALKLIANSEQILTGEATRRLLTYEKLQETGEIISGSDDIDFRIKYFNQGTRQDRRTDKHQRNVSEALKRGKVIGNRTEERKMSNKRLLLEREKQT